MRINELIVESQQIDEISLAGIGKGIGKAANVAGRAVGGAVGGTVAAAKQFGSGVKQGYQGASNAVGGGQTTPQQTTADPVSGKTPEEAMKDPRYTSDPAFKAEVDKAASFGANPTTQQQGGTTPAQGGTTPPAPAQGGAPAAEPAAEPAAPAGMKADEIVKGLGDVWGKARASQDSKTSAPAVQQQIRAMGKEAGMAGQTFESKKSVVGFRSNFLGIDL
jgi:hypothetical protein